eukprot:8189358-Karenia_brevis.AAC.1
MRDEGPLSPDLAVPGTLVAESCHLPTIAHKGQCTHMVHDVVQPENVIRVLHHELRHLINDYQGVTIQQWHCNETCGVVKAEGSMARINAKLSLSRVISVSDAHATSELSSINSKEHVAAPFQNFVHNHIRRSCFARPWRAE